MTAIATGPVMSNHDAGPDSRPDHSPSRFTAVNGRDPAPSAGSVGPNTLPSMSMNQPDRMSTPTVASSSEHAELSRDGPGLRHEMPGAPSQRTSPSGPNKHKRKRSGSGDQEARPPVELSYHSHSSSHPHPHPHSHPESSQHLHQQPHHHLHHYHHQHNQQEPQQQQQQPTLHVNRGTPTHADEVSSLHTNGNGNGPGSVSSDMDSVNAVAASGPLPSSGQSASSPSYLSDRGTNSGQVAPKRKRVFSNRTKTGCMTCRRRKKKCDEQHPACNNCIRGGFLCEGYTSRSTWQKPSTTKTPVPLQSKEGYSELGGQYLPEPSGHTERPNPGLPDHLDSRKMRPLVEDNDRVAPTYSSSPSNNPSNPVPTHAVPTSSSSSSWSKRAWSGPGHPAYPPPEHLPKPDYREVAPIHELHPRESHSKPDYPMVPPIREFTHAPPPPPPSSKPSSMPLFHTTTPEQPRPMPPAPAPASVPTSMPPSSMESSSPQTQARMALKIEHQLSARAMASEETEKDKMMRGDLYRPFDLQLVEERDRCKRALWRFNNACNPHFGLSSKEQNRLLKEILVPSPSSAANSPTSSAAPFAMGSIGQGAVVESPFNCHYGYNIQIGEDVMIHQNCSFVDDCGISIGAHSWIGPNVTLLSSMAHSSMQERKGSQSRYQGRPVIIDEDCYLGAGCIIYPGVHLNRGAYVAPGEVVKTDIVAYGFQGYKPSYM
ncbi:Fungal Zn(2)-Cys(6) binuclear cluster domain-containing protein [Penicillium ucsense]|uniref:Fungal Zn(2)-Cys(6) binuclear cluster domain-containing protein n=1 Tax=Penicillium ucsense TaxID=2839758 RepID=A0A8J8VZ64_9EURO|nr:Fungal Zn(2)-Cys(6) binuclear cluster domain-containing protein [Penicillium ucsense]KAF7735167.1 Fungal Zn(2)-Cys(6) binuclear cluster domain-containing protein [Penicillium ucsense]